MCKTVELRALQARARTEYGRLLDLEDSIRTVLGGEQHMASRAQKAAREMYQLMNSLSRRVTETRDPRGRRPAVQTEAPVNTDG